MATKEKKVRSVERKHPTARAASKATPRASKRAQASRKLPLVDLELPRMRVLSLDAGGLYGLTQAIWLHHLCVENPKFLDGTDPMYFVGCSAGAMTSLLLAKQESPREFILSGKLEKFWKTPGIYTNEKNPTDRFLSNLLLSAWLGTEDYLDVCREWMGETDTLADLKHKVVISTFNWFGQPPTFPAPGAPSPRGSIVDILRNRMEKRRSGWLQHLGEDAAQKPSLDAVTPPWVPKLFCNFTRYRYEHESSGGYVSQEIDTGDAHQRVCDVAYAAAAMPSIREVRGGVGDGGIYSANPAVDGIAAIMQGQTTPDQLPTTPGWTPSDFIQRLIEANLLAHGEASLRERHFEVLSQIRMLSVGDGLINPSYFLQNFNFGMLPFLLLPVNQKKAGYQTPLSYQSCQIIQDITLSAEAILHGNFHRLNPAVNSLPIGPAVFLVRNRILREIMINMVTTAAMGHDARLCLKAANAFLKSPNW